MRVLCINPPLRIAGAFVDYPYFVNHGVLGGAAALRAAGHDVRVVDAFALARSGFGPHPDGGRLLGAPREDVLAALGLGEPAPDAVVLGVNHFVELEAGNADVAALVSATRAAWPGVHLVLAEAHVEGMYFAEYDALAALRSLPGADALLRYECEGELPRVVAERLTGVVVPRVDPDPTALPWPAWDLIDLAAYGAFLRRVFDGPDRAGPFNVTARTLPVVTTRGCVYRCTFCSHSPRARAAGEALRWRKHALPDVEAHLERLVREHGVDKVVLLDAMVNLDAARFTALQKALDRLGLRYDLPNGLRADHLTRAQIARMRGRVEVVSVSAESGDPEVVNGLIDKNLDLKAITRVARWCKESHVPLMVHLMVGYPGETRAQVSRTFEFAGTLAEKYGALPLVQFPTPLPGTELHRRAVAGEHFADGLPADAPRDWGSLFQGKPILRWGAGKATLDPDELSRARSVLAGRLQAARHPKLIVNLTYRCNNRCVFCATGDRPSVDGGLAEHQHILDLWRARGVELVDFDGGEPTLHPELSKILGYAARTGYRVITVTTNGRRLMYDEFAHEFAHSGVTNVLFSIHGPDAKTHADLVAVGEAFEQTVAGLKNVMRLRPPGLTVGINTTVGKRNFRTLPEMGRFARDLGAGVLNVQFITPFGRANRGHTPDPVEVAPYLRQLIDESGDALDVQVINLPFCFAPGYERFLTGDVGKLQRFMVFVGDNGVNLSDYLGTRRYRTEQCDDCTFRFACKGFYEMGAGAKESARRNAEFDAARGHAGAGTTRPAEL